MGRGTFGGKTVEGRSKKAPNAPSPQAVETAPPPKTPTKSGGRGYIPTGKPRGGIAPRTDGLGLRQIARNLQQQADKYSTSISELTNCPAWSHFKPISFQGINWERRLACKNDPLLDLQTYMPSVFYLQWADFHKGLIHEVEERIRSGGKKAFGCPRASGKTAIVRGMILRAEKYGMRQFSFFIGSREDKAKKTLEFLKQYWYRSPLLQQDFPEIAYSIYRIEGRASVGVAAQSYRREKTHLVWTNDEIRFPSLLLTAQDVETYLEHDPSCVIYLPDRGVEIDRYIINNGGTITRVAGIDGSIRGEAEVHPIFLTQPRPDLVLMDDVQKDSRADSPKSCEDLERLIESAIDYLSAPNVTQACLMPCTVIRPGDVSDRYLDPLEKPDYRGERHGIIKTWPPGMDNDIILDEINGIPNPQGRLWLDYKEVREQSLRTYGDLRLANELYNTNRAVMDAGFEVSWEHRFKNDSTNLHMNEQSAIQSAMNWRFKDHLSFLSEGQNRPKGQEELTGLLLTPGEVMEHQTNIPRNEISHQWTNLVAFIDVQDEILFYTILAHDHAFNGQVVDYGTFPNLPQTKFFKKSQTMGWSLLTRNYYKFHQHEAPQSNIHKNNSTLVRAPFDAKISFSLRQCCTWLLKRQFVRQDDNQNLVSIRAVGIDTKWGKTSETVKRFIREFNDTRVISYQGHAFMPSHKQLEEYQPTAGWLFEHQQFPHVKESKWVIKPMLGSGGGRYVLADVNRLKSFTMKRLATPLGAGGCISLFQNLPENHRMFAEHVAGSEIPVSIAARGLIKDCWEPRADRRAENDYLDCLVGCVCLASICGASTKNAEEEKQNLINRKSMRKVYEEKRKTGVVVK